MNVSVSQLLQLEGEQPGFLVSADQSDGNAHICAAGCALFGIDSSGNILPCSQYPLTLGNVRENEIRDVLKSAGMVEIRSRTRNMMVGNPINFCMGTNYSETGNPFQSPPFMVAVDQILDRKGGGLNE